MAAAAHDPQFRIPWNSTLSWGLPLLGLSWLTANPFPTAVAIGTLMGIVLLLWRRDEVPILPFVCGFQWLQAAVMTIQGDLTGVELRDMTEARSIEPAVLYSLIWPLAGALGMRLWLTSRPRYAVVGRSPSFTPLLKLYLI